MLRYVVGSAVGDAGKPAVRIKLADDRTATLALPRQDLKANGAKQVVLGVRPEHMFRFDPELRARKPARGGSCGKTSNTPSNQPIQASNCCPAGRPLVEKVSPIIIPLLDYATTDGVGPRTVCTLRTGSSCAKYFYQPRC